MGFNPSAAASDATNNATAAGRGNGKPFVEAKGFLNVYIPTTSGRAKLGMIACREDDRAQKAVITYLQAAQDEEDFKLRLITLINKAEFEFNWNVKTEVELAL